MARRRATRSLPLRDMAIGIAVGVLSAYAYNYLKQHNQLPGLQPNVA